MTALLVSVRDSAEAREAAAGGADLIDIKEPRNGPLGAAEPAIWNAVRTVLGPRQRLSVALGELSDGDAAARAGCVTDADFAKLGLAGCAPLPCWQRDWRRALGRLPARTCRVAVTYADHLAAQAPAPEDVLKGAVETGCRVLLIDTFDKSQGGLLAHLSTATLFHLAAACRAQRMLLAIAGSLAAAQLPLVLPCRPDWIAVRGAACIGGRLGRVDRRLVAALADSLRQSAAATNQAPANQDLERLRP